MLLNTLLRAGLCLGAAAGLCAAGTLEPGGAQYDPDHAAGNTYESGDPPGSSSGALAVLTTTFAAGTYSGTLTTSVYANPGGGFTFAYAISNDASSVDAIENVNLAWPAYEGDTIASAGATGNGPRPYQLDRTLSGAPGVLWSGKGDGGLEPGESGAVFWFVVPDASGWKMGRMLFQSGMQTEAGAFVPAPEPGTLALIGSACGALGVARLWRKRYSMRRPSQGATAGS